MVSTFWVILAGPTGCLEMLFFCLYCNFIPNVTSSKTRFASEAWKSFFKQLCQGLQSSILHAFFSPISEKHMKDSLATFNTVSHKTASMSLVIYLVGQDGFDLWRWKNAFVDICVQRKSKTGTAKITQLNKCVQWGRERTIKAAASLAPRHTHYPNHLLSQSVWCFVRQCHAVDTLLRCCYTLQSLQVQ